MLCFNYKWVEFRHYCVLYCLGSVEARDLCNCREVRGEKNGQGSLSTPHSEGRGVYGRWTRGPLCPLLVIVNVIANTCPYHHLASGNVKKVIIRAFVGVFV